MGAIIIFAFIIHVTGILSNGVPVLDGVEKSHNDHQIRLYGGKPASRNQFPYQVSLSTPKYEGASGGILCGGMLIDREWVLTAAHCFDGKNGKEVPGSTIVYLGAYNRKNPNEEGQITYKVYGKDIIKHSDYHAGSFAHDIALIKLPKPVELNEYIQLIDLPKRNDDEITFDGQSIISSGWGQVGEGVPSSILLYINTKIVPGVQCVKKFPFDFNEKRQICINSPGKSTCQGDSGSPNVAIRADGSKVAIGITSFNAIKCVKGVPQVLTRISYYLDWIHSHTGITIKN